MTNKQKANKAFIEKLKTLTIGVGAKPGEALKTACPDCGEPVTVIPIPEPLVKAAMAGATAVAEAILRKQEKRKSNNNETAFAA